MQENAPQMFPWEKGKNDLEFFAQFSTVNLIDYLKDKPEEALYYAREVLYHQESEKYRDGHGVRPESKILFMIGGLRSRDMSTITDFEGEKVRTKDQGLLWKAPEILELVGVASVYIEGKNSDITEAVVFSEIVDIFYNLLHLQITDEEKADWYGLWIDYLTRAIGIDLLPILQMLIAKYHTRMFKNNGENDFYSENALIEKIINEHLFSKEEFLEDMAFETMFTKILRICDLLDNSALERRLKELKPKYKESSNTEENIHLNSLIEGILLGTPINK